MTSGNNLNYLFVKRFYRLRHVFIPLSRRSSNCAGPHERFYSHPLTLLLLITINQVVLQFVTYLVGLLPSQYSVALSKPPGQRDFPAFHWLIVRSFAYIALNVLLTSFSTFLSSILYIRWRTRLIIYLHSLYFTHQRYYHLLNTTQQTSNCDYDNRATAYQNPLAQTINVDDADRTSVEDTPASNSDSVTVPSPPIDNPDQRITQDADFLCRTLSTITPLVLISPFSIGFYSYRTWQVTGYYGPLAVLLYFFLWTGINKIFISAVSRTIFQQNISEGNFRFLHAQIRTYNEPIAFYDGGPSENTRLTDYFVQVLSPILYRRARHESLLSLSTNAYDYIGSIVTYLLLALVIFVFHLYDNLTMSELVGKISQTSFIIGYLIFRFNQLNDIASESTIIASNTHRIQSFVEYMESLQTPSVDQQAPGTISQAETLSIKNLSYTAPDNHQHVLMKNLNLVLRESQRLLITAACLEILGDSGMGKTSLFRILHSLWPLNGSGSFSFQVDRAYLLPQRPYFTNRALHDELCYPYLDKLPTTTSQVQIEQLLAEWNLSHILGCVQGSIYRCPKYAWQDLLSPGEIQRLSFVRLLVRLRSNGHSPIKLLFLDEITSSTDAKMEMKMYNYLIEQNLTLISIGHRHTLRQYHQMELELLANGNYVIRDIQIPG